MSRNSLSPSEILGIEMEDSLTNTLKNRRKKDKVLRDKRNIHNPALQAGDNKEHCEYCQLYLSNEKYKDHLGTKKHRRNLRKWKEQHEDEIDEDTSPASFGLQALPFPSEISSLQSTVFNRKKYESCSNTTNKNKDYVCSLVAYLTLKLSLDDGIEDFYISVFNKKWLSYGDVVIEIVKKGVIETTYAIKCKNVSNARQKLHSFKEIINIEKESEIINDLNKNELFQNTKFAVFTTAQRPWRSSENGTSSEDENNVQSPFTAGAIPIKEKELIDVSRQEKPVFEFTSKGGRKVLLFTSQHIGPNKIDHLLKDKFEDYPDIGKASKEFVKYITLWSNGKRGGDYAFRKIDTVLKLVQVLLQDIATEPIITNKNTGNNISYDIWNGIIDEVDITVLKNDPYVISRISDPIIKIMENIFGTTIRANRLINLDDEMVKSLEPEIRAYLFETVQGLEDPISLKDLYYVLWKANRIPLLLNDKGKMRDVIFDIISFLKQKGFKRKFMFLSDDPSSVTPKGDIKFFKNLRDIRQQVILSEIKLQVSKGPDLNLEQIVNSNPFFLKWVTPDMFLNLTLEKCSFKGIAPKHHAEHGNDLQIIVNSDRILKEIYQGICQSLNIQEEKNNYIAFGNLRGMDPSLLSVNTLK